MRIIFLGLYRGLWTMSRTESFARAPRPLGFILAAVLSFLKGLFIVPVGTMGPFLLENNPLKAVKGLVDYD